jgi:putative membrane protein
MRRKSWAKAGLCAALLWSGAARAEAPGPAARPRDAGADREFLQQALGVNELEVDLGRLAAERATSPDVRASARRMVDKHGQLAQRLAELAREAGAPATAELSPEQRATLEEVRSTSGRAFDEAFRRTVDAGHVRELAMYEAEVPRAASPRLRALAEQRVSDLRKAVAQVKPPAPASSPGER